MFYYTYSQSCSQSYSQSAGRLVIFPHTVKGMRIIGMRLNGIGMSRLRKGDASVLISQSLQCGGAVEDGDTELAGKAHGKSFRKKRVKQAGVFLIRNVVHANGSGRTVDAAAAEAPLAVAHLQHTETVRRQAVSNGARAVGGLFCCSEGGFPYGKGPARGAQYLPPCGMVVHVAQAGRQTAVWIQRVQRRLTQFCQGGIADI